ncbi:MAG: PIG-L family deacetylase [SAR202 cluster bacterium]|nr:PIG-L family deacetylase [SAR202 cluster bacterium]
MVENLGRVDRVLFVSPHPDDIEFSCGGTVARLVQSGSKVSYIVATNGNKGSRDTDMSRDYLESEREKEQRAAANTLGVSEVTFLDFGDGELEDDHDFRRTLVYNIRRFKPDVVFCPDPFRTTFYIHRDHRITGLVTIDAAFPYARDRLHYPEHLAQGLAVHNTEEVFFYGTETPDTFVDITETVELKSSSILMHTSQVKDMISGANGQSGFLEQLKKRSLRIATENRQDFKYAEAFRSYGLRKMFG